MNAGARSVPLLSVRSVTKGFPGVVANDRVSLDLLPGEVHALLGENGAGKTTLVSILYGLLQPDEGELWMDGARLRVRDPRHAMQLGIGLVAQHFHLARRHNVAENLALGLAGTPFVAPTRALRGRAAELAQRYGLGVDMDARVGQLSPGEQQRVEILKVLLQGARVLMLDEPTSVLTPQEADALFRVVERMRQAGKSILFISHKLDEVRRVASRITVLRHGAVVARFGRSEAGPEELARAMVGKPMAIPQRLGIVADGPPLLRVENVWVKGRRGVYALRGASLHVRSGEVLGIAGVAGNGQSELAQVLTGLLRPERGTVRLGGTRAASAQPAASGEPSAFGEPGTFGEPGASAESRASGASAESRASAEPGLAWAPGATQADGFDLTTASPREARAAGVAYIPEDRRHEGTVGNLTVLENLVLRQIRDPEFARGVVIDWRRAEAFAKDAVERFDIRTPSLRTPARLLSGGNVQKIVLARELSGAPRLVVASHPTYGLDVGSTAMTHEALIAQSTRGAAVVVISEDLDELLRISDRIAVLYEGRVVGECPAADAATPEGLERLGMWMAGSEAA